jgi:putative hydrolase of the HAD superfamily
MRLIRAVIFDFGGVLIRLTDFSGRQKWEQRLGLEAGELARLVFESEAADRSMVGQATEDDIWRFVAATCGLDAELLPELRRDFWGNEQLDEQLVSFIRDLRPRYKTAILSNAWPGARQLFTEVLGLGDVVDEMIISCEEGVAKPDARIFQIAVDRLGVEPEEAVFVDDVAVNVHRARAFGLQAILFENLQQAVAAVRNLLDETQTGLHEPA